MLEILFLTLWMLLLTCCTYTTIDPKPSETKVRTNYTIENNDYELFGSPAGGVFSGQGVIKKQTESIILIHSPLVLECGQLLTHL